MIGRSLTDNQAAATLIPLDHLRECLRSGELYQYEVEHAIGGQPRTIDVTLVPVPPETENGARLILAKTRDITDRMEFAARLRQAQKLEAIGQLTAGVAHDFNNLLAIFAGNAQLAKSRNGADLAHLMDNILRASQSGRALIRHLLLLSRRRTSVPELVDLRSEIPLIAECLRIALQGRISLVVNVQADVWPVEVDPAELEIALLNVAVNARDAMPDGGRLHIEVSNTPSDHNGSVADGPAVRIALSDTGCGIPQSLLGKIFDPFFSTKEAGRGTGLGLNQVHDFVQEAAGSITVESGQSTGTRFVIDLPRSHRTFHAADRPTAPNEIQPAVMQMVEHCD